MTNLESLKHIRKLAIILLDPPQQIVAQEERLDSSCFLVLFKRVLDPVQFTLSTISRRSED